MENTDSHSILVKNDWNASRLINKDVHFNPLQCLKVIAELSEKVADISHIAPYKSEELFLKRIIHFEFWLSVHFQ